MLRTICDVLLGQNLLLAIRSIAGRLETFILQQDNMLRLTKCADSAVVALAFNPPWLWP